MAVNCSLVSALTTGSHIGSFCISVLCPLWLNSVIVFIPSALSRYKSEAICKEEPVPFFAASRELCLSQHRLARQVNQ